MRCFIGVVSVLAVAIPDARAEPQDAPSAAARAPAEAKAARIDGSAPTSPALQASSSAASPHVRVQQGEKIDPVRCGPCHLDANDPLSLSAPYQRAYYGKYDEQTAALCWKCHDSKLATEANTRTSTGFRDGNRNLHYLHVVPNRGRSCKACHESHPAAQAKLIRDGIPYGPKAAILKLTFSATSDGGQCAKTCHEQKQYVRSKADARITGAGSQDETAKERQAHNESGAREIEGERVQYCAALLEGLIRGTRSGNAQERKWWGQIALPWARCMAEYGNSVNGYVMCANRGIGDRFIGSCVQGK